MGPQIIEPHLLLYPPAHPPTHLQDDTASLHLRVATAQIVGPHLRSLKLVSTGGGQVRPRLQCNLLFKPSFFCPSSLFRSLSSCLFHSLPPTSAQATLQCTMASLPPPLPVCNPLPPITRPMQVTSAFLKHGAQLQTLKIDFFGSGNGLPRQLACAGALTALHIQCSSRFDRYEGGGQGYLPACANAGLASLSSCLGTCVVRMRRLRSLGMK